MNTYTLGNTEYNFNPRLRATENIRKAFGKDYTRLIGELDKLSIKELIKFIYNVLDKPELSLEEFTDWCFDNIGKGDIEECVSWLVIQLQYPGITEEEFIKKTQESQAKEKALASRQD